MWEQGMTNDQAILLLWHAYTRTDRYGKDEHNTRVLLVQQRQ